MGTAGADAAGLEAAGASLRPAGGEDPWAASAAKLAVKDLPAHIRKHLEEALDKQVAEAASRFEATAKAVTAAASKEFLESITAITADLSQRHETTERSITAISSRTAVLETANAELKASVAKLENLVSQAEARAPALNLDALGAWNRDPDPTVFWCSCSQDFNQPELERALQQWFTDANIEPAHVVYNTVGPAKRHSFQLSGGTLVAEPRAQRLHAALRIGKAWRTFSVATSPGTAIPLYVSADKSPKMVRQEVHAKRLANIIQSKKQHMALRVHRTLGYVATAGEALVRLHVGLSSDAPTRLQWSAAAATKGIDEATQRAITTEFNSNFADPLTAAQWL